MPRNKPRLQLALYARPKHPGTYHYALLIAPKRLPGPVVKHHVKNTLQVDHSGTVTHPWRYERGIVSDIGAEQRLLVRIVIGKVTTSVERVQQTLESVPVVQVSDQVTFSCRTWARDAFHDLVGQGMLSTKVEGWEDVERMALEYLDKKRGQGRWDGAGNAHRGVPLMDILEQKEIVP